MLKPESVEQKQSQQQFKTFQSDQSSLLERKDLVVNWSVDNQSDKSQDQNKEQDSSKKSISSIRKLSPIIENQRKLNLPEDLFKQQDIQNVASLIVDNINQTNISKESRIENQILPDSKRRNNQKQSERQRFRGSTRNRRILKIRKSVSLSPQKIKYTLFQAQNSQCDELGQENQFFKYNSQLELSSLSSEEFQVTQQIIQDLQENQQEKLDFSLKINAKDFKQESEAYDLDQSLKNRKLILKELQEQTSQGQTQNCPDLISFVEDVEKCKDKENSEDLPNKGTEAKQALESM